MAAALCPQPILAIQSPLILRAVFFTFGFRGQRISNGSPTLVVRPDELFLRLG